MNPPYKSGFFSNWFKRKRGSRRGSSPTPSETSLESESYSDSLDAFISPARTESWEGSEGGIRESVGLRSHDPFAQRGRLEISKDYWMRDEKVKECYDCKVAFSTFRRRHHCRICGQIFCHKCAASIVSGESFGYQGEIRVCNYCLKVVDAYYKNPKEIPLQFNDNSGRNSWTLYSTPYEQGAMEGFRKILSPSFVVNENTSEYGNVPFRTLDSLNNSFDEEEDRSYAEEEYAGFKGLSMTAPKSFVKVKTSSPMEAELSPDQEHKRISLNAEKRKTQTLMPRRKFSTRTVLSRYGSQSQFASLDTEKEEIGANHFRSVSSALNVEINAASVNHVRYLMRQMLQTAEVDHIEEWEEVIVNLLLKVCNKINPDVRHGDEMDVRNYVKIKRIQGGYISDSMYIKGVVATKKITHKHMLKPLSKPKILLLTFPLEYQRVQNQYMSLETLIAQEREHLKNLVNRVIALRPDIVMVEKTVARVAFEYLLEANIVVIQNVKLNVLSAVSRCSKADIIHSIDKLSTKKMGTCDEFTFKTFANQAHPGGRKSFLFMEGCDENLGCTLVLRGSTIDVLKKVKEIVDFLVYVVYSLKLETCLFRDQYAQTPSIEARPKMPSNLPQGNSPLEIAVKNFESKILSTSPNVTFPLPYVIEQMLKKEKKAPIFPGDFKSVTSGKSESEAGSKEWSSSKDATAATDTASIKEAVQVPLAKLPDLDLLSPMTEQNLLVMYSNICVNSTEPCIPSFPHLIEYYRDSDLTLGQFIEDTCFGAKFNCPVKQCETLMLSHYRSYVHYRGQLNVSVDMLPCPVQGMEDRIMMWSLCRICQESTPFIPMSEETWKYSFGKYLELTFYHSKLNSRSVSCQHDIHREHTRFFAFRGFTVRFQYEAIELFDVCGPPMHRVPKPETISHLRQQDMETLRNQINAFYDSVLDRVEYFTLDIVPMEKVNVCKGHLSELSTKAHMEKKFMLQLLQQNFIATSPNDYFAINSVFKTLLENVSQWDAEFASFMRTFLQSDGRDLRKLTAAQLRRMFIDKDVAAELKQNVFTGVQDSSHPENDYMYIDRTKLPVLDTAESIDVNEEYFTPPLKRTLSLEILKSSGTMPDVMHSPVRRTIPLDESVDENDSPSKSSRSDSKDESKTWATVYDSEPETGNISDTMYPRNLLTKNKNLKTESERLAQYNSLHRTIVEEDFVNDEVNAITGVTAESEFSQRYKEDKPVADSRPTSLMKTITNLWNGNLANFLPLAYPSSPSEHIFPDSPIIVRENELSSIIAFSLTSVHYLEKLQLMRDGPDSLVPRPFDENNKFTIGFDDNPTDLEETLLRDTGTHIHYQFWDGPVKFHCKIFFAEQFDALRRNCGIAGTFEQSLARCVKWDTTGGKSNSAFMKTRDDWLVVKNISPIELEALVSFSPAYFEYMSQAFFHDLPTVLAKIFGFYQISFKNPNTRKSVKMDVLVMENLFHERQSISKIFDLKGSVRNRHVQSTGKQNQVLLDKNLLEFIYESPLFIREHSKKMLRASVYNDTLFLSKLNVMDYSLLVGIDNESKELVIGIVDFIRTFTWDKKLESWVKETGLLGGGKEPTIVTPRQYKNRFREAMERYYLMVPEKFLTSSLISVEDQ